MLLGDQRDSIATWIGRYPLAQLHATLIRRFWIPEATHRLYLDHYTAQALSRLPPDLLQLDDLDGAYVDYDVQAQESVRAHVVRFAQAMGALEKRQDARYSSLLTKLVFYMEAAASFAFDGDRIAWLPTTIDVFVYRFGAGFRQDVGTEREWHVKDGFVGQQVRYLALRQRSYTVVDPATSTMISVHRPRHLVWRDAHANVTTSVDADLIRKFNAAARLHKCVYLIPTSREYETDWHDTARCAGTGLYRRRTAIAGWVQMCNFYEHKHFLPTKVYLTTVGMAFLVQRASGIPVLSTVCVNPDPTRGGPNGHIYGVDEYTNTAFFRNAHFVRHSIYLFHTFRYGPLLRNASGSVYLNFTPTPIQLAFVFVLRFLLAQPGAPKGSIVMRDVLHMVETLRGVDPKTFPYEVRSCLRVLLALIPTRYQCLLTLYYPAQNAKTWGHLEDRVPNLAELVAQASRRSALPPRTFDTLTFENLKAAGIACAQSIYHNATDWCEEPYFAQAREDRVPDCPPGLYLSGFYNDPQPVTGVAHIRWPDDLSHAFATNLANTADERLRLTDYKINDAARTREYETRFPGGVIPPDLLEMVLRGVSREARQSVHTIAAHYRSTPEAIGNTFVWRALFFGGIDFPTKWFQLAVPEHDYPADMVLRPYLLHAKACGTDKQWKQRAMRLLGLSKSRPVRTEAAKAEAAKAEAVKAAKAAEAAEAAKAEEATAAAAGPAAAAAAATCPDMYENKANLVVPSPIQHNTVRVWMYWDDEPFPPSVELCLNNWRHMAARSSTPFEVVVVTQKTLSDYIDKTAHPCLMDENTQWRALRSDTVRLCLLHRYGGVYMDATCILTESLDWLAADGGLQMFQAYYNPRHMTSCERPVLESSFLAAPAGHPFVAKWLAIFSQMQTCDREGIDRALQDTPIQPYLDRHYHFVYHCVTKMLREHPLDEFAPYRIRSERSGKYMSFLSRQNVDDMCTNGAAIAYGPVLKLVGDERRHLDGRIAKGTVERGSFLWKYLFAIREAPDRA